MASVNFTNITVPTFYPFDKNKPTQNAENGWFLFGQIVQLFKDSGAVLEIPLNVSITTPEISVNLDLSALVQAVQDLQYNSEEIQLPNLIVKLSGIVQDIA